MKNLIAFFVSCLLVFTIGTMSCQAQTVKGITMKEQPIAKKSFLSPAGYVQSTASATIVVAQQGVKVVLLKCVKSGTQDKLFKMRTIPKDSLTHFGVVSNLYMEGDTLLLRQVRDFR